MRIIFRGALFRSENLQDLLISGGIQTFKLYNKYKVVFQALKLTKYAYFYIVFASHNLRIAQLGL